MTAEAIRLIGEQQRGVKPRSATWMVGEQLKDICRGDPAAAELLARDLTVEGMGIVAAEKRIAARAKENQVDGCGCVTWEEAEEILREFYGLGPPPEAEADMDPRPRKPAAAGTGLLDLADFL